MKTKNEYMAHHEKSFIRKTAWIIIDTLDLLFGRGRAGLIPPRSITHFTSKEWVTYGKDFNYNPNGKFESKTFKFPYEDNYFDFVYLLSVFTHMYTPDIENFLKKLILWKK